MITNNHLQQHAIKDKTRLQKHHHLDSFEEHTLNRGHPHSHSTHHHHDGVTVYHHEEPQHLNHNHNLPRTETQRQQLQQQLHQQLPSTFNQFLPLLEVSLLKILLDRLHGQLWWSL